jgi:hypothetical protein
MMQHTMSPSLVTLPSLARAIGVSIHTFNKWKVRYADFPEPRERVTSTMHLYQPRDFVGFLKRHPGLGNDDVRGKLTALTKTPARAE